MFTFADPQSQQFSQNYGGGQFFSENQGTAFTGQQNAQTSYAGMSYGDSNQSMPNSPYYSDEASAFTYGQNPRLPQGQQNPGLTPTMRNYQGDVQQRPAVYSNVPSPMTPGFGSSPNYPMAVQSGMSYHDQGTAGLHAAKRMRALDDGDGDTSSVEGEAHEDGGAQGKGEGAKPHKP